MRSEQAIFDDLAKLCVSKGFIHAIAAICFRDNFVGFDDELSSQDMAKMFSRTRLIRTEITTLIGLMMRAPVDFSLPEPQILSDYVKHSEALLEELHRMMLPPELKHRGSHSPSYPDADQFSFGKFLRETIFYGRESAYHFQYRDLAPRKYRADSKWLLKNKAINLAVGREICRSITHILDLRLLETVRALGARPAEEQTVLPGFVFSCNEIASRINRPIEDVTAFVEAFTLPTSELNTGFTSLNAFNAAYSCPFIHKGGDEFVLLQYYGVSEAFYDTPFYWMCADKSYAPTALRHRGDFTEAFATERLTHVFGSNRVIQNVEMLNSKGKVLGEIDVLVIFGDRAIVLQAKSKKLTLGARKGNDRLLQDDFKKAVQDAVDQSFHCASLIGNPSVTLHCKDGRTVLLPRSPSTIFPVTVVADHYPALAFQARHFLKAKSTERIVPPLVTDVFALDAITEMLTSPLRFLSYLSFRARFGDRLMASHEHVLLSYHLKQNLWLRSDRDLMLIEDDFAADLDVAMSVRRDGIPGAATPDGILTRYLGTPLARIIAEIEDQPEPIAIDFGLILLELSEDTIRTINKYVQQVLKRTSADGGFHDMTIGLAGASTGLTVHCSRLASPRVTTLFRNFCEVKKYSQKANSWFGIALRPDGSIQFLVKLVGDWKFDPGLETLMAKWLSPKPDKKK